MVDVPAGLTSLQVKSLQIKHGKNKVDSHITTSWHILLRQIKSPFIYLLLGAAALALILQEKTDAILIVFFTLFNVGLGFYQEYRSEITAKLLTKYLRRYVSVVRDNKPLEIFAEDLVPGDIIFLEVGDIIPADAKLIVSKRGISVDESILTGESVPVDKTVPGGMLLSGTTVTSGTGYAVILRIGNSSELGKIAKAAAGIVRVSAFEKNISLISSFTLKLITIILLATYLTNLALKGPGSFLESTLFAIALAVSVIPEALPVVVTFSLSRGAMSLARRGSIVKRLSSIEDLGGIEILATDKTGTITENELSIKDFYVCKGTTLTNLKHYLAFASPGKDHVDKILRSLSTAKREIIDEIRFDANRKRSTTIINLGKSYLTLVKGAPEVLLKLYSHNPKTGEYSWLKTQEDKGNRVIAVAANIFTPHKNCKPEKEEESCHIIGYVALADTVKKTAIQAVKKARALNVVIKIISGDSREVTYHIAKSVGLVNSPSQVITGDELNKLETQELHKAVEHHTCFARISPIQKSQIIDIMQESHVVGFVGDGVNDAPALKSADVAIAVDHATDVAREAADIILKSKSLTTIIDGIEEGRIVFGNTAKYIKMTLAANLGNFFSVAIASLLIPFLPMLPIQILLVNLLSDFPMIAIAADTMDPKEISSPGVYDIRDIATITSLFGLVSSTFDLIFFAIFVRFGAQTLQTGWFIESIVTELLFFYSIRTRSPLWKSTPPPLGITLLSSSVILLTILLPFLPVIGPSLQLIPLPPHFLLLNLALIFTYLVITETVKIFYYRSK